MYGTGLRTLVRLAAVAGIIGILSAPVAAGPQEDAPVPALIRMHVIPASDRPEDQALKLQVRDALLAYLIETPLARPGIGFAEAVRELDRRVPEIEMVARRAVAAAGAAESVRVTFGVRRYEARALGQAVLPAGDYVSLEVVIGAGEGRNFWCILFPSSCLVPEEAEALSRAQARSNIAEAAAPAPRPDEATLDPARIRLRWWVWDVLFGRFAVNREPATAP